MTVKLAVPLLLFVFVLGLTTVDAQTSTFTYRGRLTDTSVPASGTYDFEFVLFDAQAGGNQVAAAQTVTGVAVASRNFTVQLDYGTAVFSGDDRFLEIRFKLPADAAYTPLAAREQITSAPYAIRALTAATADIANDSIHAAHATNTDTLDNLDSSNFVQTNTTAFIRNQNAAPQAADFNINGKARANTVHAVESFGIGNTRVLSTGAAGNNNLFVGVGTGLNNTTGVENSFFGRDAGYANTTGFANSFAGAFAGAKNTTGRSNSFFGSNAGAANTAGSSNSFVGNEAGLSNTTGSSNTFVGFRAGSNNTTGASNSFFGASAGLNNTTGFSNTFLGRVAGLNNTTGNLNLFVGDSAGHRNTTGSFNAFIGGSAGSNNTTGYRNSFAGHGAGYENTSGDDNSFFGMSAGRNNTTGYDNSFFGQNAGYSNTTGLGNSFFGTESGQSTTTGIYNSFFGDDAGRANTDGSDNTFIGASAGQGTTTGDYNSFVGVRAGDTNTTGSYNTIVGSFANVGSGNLSYAAAIGYRAVVNTSDTIVIGKTATAVSGRPADTVRIPGDLVVTGNIAKGSGSFKIDHPLDPANKYLSHSFVESPDMMNMYNGNVTTNARGEAVVRLPDYFEALNRDFRYQLTVIGTFAQAIIGEKIKANQFLIRTDKPNIEVSWQVTGIRQDKFANENRIPTTEDKSEVERGKCLYAPLCGGTSINDVLRKP